jgi:hypothetical protein
MSPGARTCRGLPLLVAGALALGGCSNPDAPVSGGGSGEQAAVSSPGEPKAPPPPPDSSYTPANVKRTPVEALATFAVLYVNWNYRSLTAQQRTLGAISLGAARTAELQAAASSASDGTLTAARIVNRGSVVSVARDRDRAGSWVVVTHEQTSGTGDYEGLPGAYHVTVARLARVPGGYAVSEWLPQS